MRYQVNAPHVIAEVIDGELIVLNMESGKYFSVRGAGPDIWQLLASAHNAEEAVERLALHYDADRDTLLDAVETLRDSFLEDELLSAADAAVAVPVTLAVEGAGHPFQAPSLEAYTDMQGLLLLDPIHEVEEIGWPHTQK